MSTLKRVFLAGSSGETGKRLMSNLIACNSIAEIHVLVRTPAAPVEPKVHQHIVDFNDLTSTAIPNPNKLSSISFCTLGTTIKKAGSRQNFQQVDLTYVENFANWCLSNDCDQLAVISSVDANRSGSNFYLKTKDAMESSLSNLPLHTLWIFRPSLLLGDRQDFRLGEKLGGLASRFIAPLLIGPYEKYKPIQMSTVAKALSNLVKSNDEGIHILEGAKIKALADSA